MNGFLNLLKPPGMTSSDAVVRIRRTLSGEKVGHAGTLDPEAAGVLPIMIGKAARLFDVLADKEKAYVAEIAFGAATDTQDAQGRVTATGDKLPTQEALLAALPAFIGDIAQVPPAYSALKVGGQTAYALARRGEMAELAARPAHVDDITLLEWLPPDAALLRVRCGKGFYVRTLCHDIGAALGCPAHLRFLLRTQSGVFTIENSVTLEEWQDAADRAALLMPPDAPLAHLPLARVSAAHAPACRNGNPLRAFEQLDEAALLGGFVRVYCGEAFAGLGRYAAGEVRFQAMLME
jgi:tRNA pseudouridine55 synthase